MTAADALPDLLALPREDKLCIIDALAASLDDVALSDETKAMLDARWEEHLRNPESALSVDEFFEMHRARRSCAA